MQRDGELDFDSVVGEPTGELLELHGTKLMELKPSSIVHAAETDLQKRERNVKYDGCAPGAVYTFHRRHVRAAKSVHDLLRRALKNVAIGRSSAKKSTRIIYRDAKLLEAALNLVPEESNVDREAAQGAA